MDRLQFNKILVGMILAISCLAASPASAGFFCIGEWAKSEDNFCVDAQGQKCTRYKGTWWILEETRGSFRKLKPWTNSAGQGIGGISHWIAVSELETSEESAKPADVEFKIVNYLGPIWETNYLILYGLDKWGEISTEDLAIRVGLTPQATKASLENIKVTLKQGRFGTDWVSSRDERQNCVKLKLTEMGKVAFQFFQSHPNWIKKEAR